MKFLSSTTHLSTDGRQIVIEALKESRLTEPIPTLKAGTSNSNPIENLMTIQTKARVKEIDLNTLQDLLLP